jgi:16S rRNA (adenine1518-N6/adenine1519-N6)-dimethyltransferase
VLAPELKQKARAFNAKKRLGQNFLVDPAVLSKIASGLEISAGEPVLEIGPGLGFLTTKLLDSGARLTAVELDKECVQVLRKLESPTLNLVQADFLACDLTEILAAKTKVVGNIPYNITSPIIAKLLGEIGQPSAWLHNIESVTLTVQLELAQRLVAGPGSADYSQISVLVAYFARPEILFLVEPEQFHPIPEVRSAVVRLTPHAAPPVSCKNVKLLKQVIKSGFRQKRKMLANNLSFLRFSREQCADLFSDLNFDPQVRAESVSLKQFCLLADALDAAIKDSAQQR